MSNTEQEPRSGLTVLSMKVIGETEWQRAEEHLITQITMFTLVSSRMIEPMAMARMSMRMVRDMKENGLKTCKTAKEPKS